MVMWDRGIVRRLVVAGLALACAAFVLVAGCSRNPGGQLPGFSGEAIKARSEGIHGFGFVRTYTEQSDGKAVLAVEFSQPLRGTQDFSRLLTFKETMAAPGGWVLGDGVGEHAENRVLRYTPIEPNTRYTLHISGDLAASDGHTLGKDVEQNVFTGDIEPSVGFASQGSLLPSRDSRGLPVVSINVDEVGVEFLKVDESDLPRFFAEYRKPEQRSGWALDNGDKNTGAKDPSARLASYAHSVYANRFLLDGKRNERAVSYLPIQDIKELREPGLYFAVMRRAGSFDNNYQTTFYTVSDIGLHTRAYRDQMFVHTASLADGSALAGVTLRVLDAKGETVFKSETDGNGNALLKYTLDATHVLLATHGKQVSALPFNQPAVDLSEFDVGGRTQGPFEVYPWAGRDLYRPGENVGISMLVRDADGNPLAGTKAPPLYVRLKQPNGNPFIETRVEPGALGYYRFERTIPQDAPTGEWSVEFRLDPASKDAVHGMKLHIEEFLPERLKLDMSIADAALAADKPLPLRVDGRYLYGAPAAGNRFTARLAYQIDTHPLAQMPDYFFGDPTLAVPKASGDAVDDHLDDQGHLAQDVALPKDLPTGSPVKIVVEGSVYESGGRSVDRGLARTLWPADVLVGVRPLFDAKDGSDANAQVQFEVVRVDRQGRPQPASKLEAKLTREHRDYHWSYEEGSGWRFDYSSRFDVVNTQTLDTGMAPVRLQFPVEWGDYRLEIRDPKTGLTMRYPFTAGWSWRDDNRGVDARPDKIKLALDKTSYKTGDTLKVTVTPPEAGKGILLVESDHLLYVQEIDAKPGSTFSIPVTADWERHDVYVTALVYRGGTAERKVTPSRAIGEAYVPMDRAPRKVAVGLTVPALQRPQTDMPVTVAAPQLAGQEAYVVVTATDVGITNISGWPAPDPFGYFFAKRRLGTDAYDVYGRIIESFEGGMARLRYGGDAAAPMLKPARPVARVRMTDLYAAPVRLDARGIAHIRMAMPDFNGSARVSAVVYAKDRYGALARETVVRAPIVAEPGLPRVLAPGDQSEVSLDVTNFTGKPGTFQVQVSGEGPVGLDAKRALTLKPNAKQTMVIPVSARQGYGVGKVRVKVDGNGYHVDRSYDLPVRAAWPGVLRVDSQRLAADAEARFDPGLARGLLDGSVNARMTVSALPPLPFAASLKGLLDYPYGCAEQTTSKGYAALILDENSARALGVKGLGSPARLSVIEGSFGRLASMQAGNGYYQMWAGNEDSDVNPMLAPYVAEYLIDAREAGFAVPDAMLQKTLERLNDDVLSDGVHFSLAGEQEHMRFAYQAYAGFVLSRINRAPLGALRQIYDDRRNAVRTGLPLVRLGIALQQQGDKVRGSQAIQQGLDKPWPKDDPYFEDYATPIRDLALMLALLNERGIAIPQEQAQYTRLAQLIDARRAEGWLWMSTQEQIAIGRLGKALLRKHGGQISGSWKVGSTRVAATPGVSIAREFDGRELQSGIAFVPDHGMASAFVTYEVAGVSDHAPASTAPTLKINRSYFTLDGKPWKGSTLKEGEALIAQIEIESKAAMPDALVTDLLPAGLEVENLNLGDDAQWADVVIAGVRMNFRRNAADINHEEFRDDRYVAAVKLGNGSHARVFYLVRAVSPGTYTVPPPMVEDMYRPTLRGVGKSAVTTLKVVPP